MKSGSKDQPGLFPDSGRSPVSGVSFAYELDALGLGYRYIAGVDEVGRGSLAGPVVASAVVLDISRPIPNGLDDSKKLSATKRESLEIIIREQAIAFAIGEVSAEEIDRINILEATKKAMKAAIALLSPEADFLLLDAIQLKGLSLPQKSIIKGDSISASIAAASIIAKTYRDRQMRQLALEYPHYGFESNVGYGAKSHLDALKKYGPCEIHRKSFRGVL